MDAGQAWTKLTHGGSALGVRANDRDRDCYLTKNRTVECDRGDGTDATDTFNHSEFLQEFTGCQFKVIQTQDMAT